MRMAAIEGREREENRHAHGGEASARAVGSRYSQDERLRDSNPVLKAQPGGARCRASAEGCFPVSREPNSHRWLRGKRTRGRVFARTEDESGESRVRKPFEGCKKKCVGGELGGNRYAAHRSEGKKGHGALLIKLFLSWSETQK